MKMDFDGFKKSLIEYLEEYKQAVKDELETIEHLPNSEKAERGYAVLDATIASINKDYVELLVNCNFTKWRTGDRVQCELSNKQNRCSATVIENYTDKIIISEISGVEVGDKLNLFSTESELTGIIIEAIKYVQEGGTGSEYFKILGGIIEPKVASPIPLNIDKVAYNDLNRIQQNAVEKIAKRPQIYAIQGPPGTGKTNVLASIAQAYSKKGKSVLVLSNSHQAVNNALNKIVEKGIPTYKIGSEYKTQALNEKISACKSIWEYKRKKGINRRQRFIVGDILGMTIYGAIINLIFQKSDYTPAVILVDEASQIPLAMVASLAKLGAGTTVFIGDERQMPPIFPQKMEDHIFSKSIFEHLQCILPFDLKTTLTVSYRMNKVICEFVSKRYYEPYGICLSSYDKISERHIPDERIEDSVELMNIESYGNTESNEAEAVKAVEIADRYLSNGFDVAVVSPYRKQVNCVREIWNKNSTKHRILIDTVERLQGQDVDVIILTMACSDDYYYMLQRDFLLNPNRMNVMVSRAKQKVVILKSPIVEIKIDS